MTAPQTDLASYRAWCADIRAASGWLRLQLAHELAKRINRGDFDMTTCLRCGQPKPADGDDWCRRCEDENAAEVVAAMDGLFDEPD